MIPSRHSQLPWRTVFLALGDVVLISLAMLAAAVLRHGYHSGFTYIEHHWYYVSAAWIFFRISHFVTGLYQAENLQHVSHTLVGATISVCIGMVLMMTFFSTSANPSGRGILAGYAVFIFIATLAGRVIAGWVSRLQRHQI